MTTCCHRFVFVVLLAAALAVAGITHAQQRNTWKRLDLNVGKTIGCGFFWDKDHGLVGSGVRWGHDVSGPHCDIYKTTDGGATWSAAVVPALINGAVTSIWMQDSLVGYASIFPSVDYGYGLTFGGSSLWKTTDAGSTWFDPYKLDHVITSVYGQNGFMVFTLWDLYESTGFVTPDSLGGEFSFDSGRTWTSAFRRCNGIAFSDSLNGVITEMNPNFGGGNFWCTFDAGHTWQKTSAQYESWSIYSPPGTRMYFCANESQFNVPHQSVNWSTDGGLTWRERYQFGAMRFTGTITGKGNTLYIQTDTSRYAAPSDSLPTYLPNYGLFRSDDLGASWHPVNGPSNSRDTRFCVTGCAGEVVYAFDAYGGVWKTVDGGDSTLVGGNPRDAQFLLSSDTIFWTPSPCGDSISITATSSSCVPMMLDSASSLHGDLLWQVDSAFPVGLVQNDSARMTLRYDPIRMANDTSVVRVYGHSGKHPVTRDLHVFTSNNLAEGLTLSRDTSVMRIPGCTYADDTIVFGAFGCGSMVIDSVVIPSTEVTVTNHFPDTVEGKSARLLYLLFVPDSVGLHEFPARIYAHAGRRSYDTTIAITAEAIATQPRYVLDSTAIDFATKYCVPRSGSLNVATQGCDTIIVDSLVTSDGAFSVTHAPGSILNTTRDSLVVSFGPDSLGAANATLHVFGHTRHQDVDTVITLSGANAGHSEALTLTSNTLALPSIACHPKIDSLVLSNQCCELLYLDSIVAPIPLQVAFDTARFPMASNDSLTLLVQFTPQDSMDETLPVRIVMHTSKRKVDTTVFVSVSNHVPANPLALSADSLNLFTKYCQPIAKPFTVSNMGCNAMTIDSLVLVGDARHEFSTTMTEQSIGSLAQSNATLQFTPDTSGQRIVQLHLYAHEGAHARDTILTVSGENHTAPEPYIPDLPSLPAGAVLRVPIMLRPTLDTFTLGSFAFHLHQNTDLLTPFALDFTGTSSQFRMDDVLIAEEGSGASVRVHLSNTLSNLSQLALPIVYVLDSVRVAMDTLTTISIDSFATDREPQVIACSVPGSEFALAPACGNAILLDLLRSQPIAFGITAISPNPSGSARAWKLDYTTREAPLELSVILYDARGVAVYRSALAPGGIGDQSVTVPVPNAEGDYFLVLASPRERMARNVTARN
ncbi:MAG: hypothetical protein Q8922_07090 [Bacteroidota bacterium]|nr:hypothetical protein [Bacteroidota bacterium]MDP4234010.1 hypothetical protein [Bacteroidota bacterium]MDP4242877.1 hypothetical protein [Bacteroidota bacterium]MDP4287685.1 hypothetical protein [Bacteroidota bacterium]